MRTRPLSDHLQYYVKSTKYGDHYSVAFSSPLALHHILN